MARSQGMGWNNVQASLISIPVYFNGNLVHMNLIEDSVDKNTQRTSQNNKKPEFKYEDVTSLVVFLSQRLTNSWLNKGATEDALAHFPFKKSSIQRIWKKARWGILDPDVVVDIEHRKKGQSGCKRKYESEDFEVMAAVLLLQRTTLMSLSYAIDIPKYVYGDYWNQVTYCDIPVPWSQFLQKRIEKNKWSFAVLLLMTMESSWTWWIMYIKTKNGSSNVDQCKHFKGVKENNHNPHFFGIL